MTKFKIGDRVRRVRAGGAWASSNIGLVGSIISVGPEYVDVLFDGNGEGYQKTDWGSATHLEFITPEKTLIHNGLTYDLREPQPVEWKWGMWADYEGKRVFVMSEVDIDGEVKISHPGFYDGNAYTTPDQLTPIDD